MIGAPGGGMSPGRKCLRFGPTVARFATRAVTIGLLVALAAPAAGGAATGGAATLRGNGMIAFDRDRGGNWDIYLKAATRRSHAFRVTTNVAADFAPSFSPGGTRIAFTSDRGGNYDIYTISTTGHDLRRITSNPAQDAFPSWSPDGRRIAFASNRSGDWEIYTVAASGAGKPLQITHHQGVDSLPVWSPDGTRIAFDSPRNGHYQICVVPSTGGTVTELTADAFRNVQPAWSPDGLQIAFASNRSGSFDVWVLTLASGDAAAADHRLRGRVSALVVAQREPDPVRAGHGRRADGRRDAGRRRPRDGADRPARERDPPVAAGSRHRRHRHRAAQGPAAGGTSVTITGHNFAPGATVRFGSAAATNVVVRSSTSITATSPPGSGTVDVIVTTTRGSSAVSPADEFTYN